LDSGYEVKGNWTVNPGVNNNPNFALSIASDQQAKSPKQFVSPGGKATFRITLNSLNGFADTVLLTASGVSHSSAHLAAPIFDPPSVQGSGSSIMTISTANGTPPGLYAIKVTGFVSASGIHHEGVAYVGVATGPPETAVTPNQGAGSRQSFTFTATDLSTADSITGLSFMITSALDGNSACRMHFEPTTGLLWLASDDGSSWSQTMLGSKETLRNRQCSVGGVPSDFHLTKNGNDFVLKVPVIFTPAFAGPKKVFIRSINLAGFDTGFQEKGSWTIPQS
jgi:hypothetical protein